MTPTIPPDPLLCAHRLGSRDRHGIRGVVPPSVEVYCTEGCGFTVTGPNNPMAWLNAGAKIAGDRSAVELHQLRVLAGQLLILAQGDQAPEADRLSAEDRALVLEVAPAMVRPAVVQPCVVH